MPLSYIVIFKGKDQRNLKKETFRYLNFLQALIYYFLEHFPFMPSILDCRIRDNKYYDIIVAWMKFRLITHFQWSIFLFLPVHIRFRHRMRQKWFMAYRKTHKKRCFFSVYMCYIVYSVNRSVLKKNIHPSATEINQIKPNQE